MLDKRSLTTSRRWTSFFFSFGGLALALLFGSRLPAATFTYPVNEKLLCSASRFVNFTGTLTVDQLGNNLGLDDITDWNLQLIDNTLQKLQTFQPSNSGFKMAGAPVLAATKDALTITLHQSVDNLELAGPSNTQWIFSGGQNDPTELVLIPNSSRHIASKSFDGFPATITANAFTATAAPEPNSAALLPLVIAGGLLWWRKRPHSVALHSNTGKSTMEQK